MKDLKLFDVPDTSTPILPMHNDIQLSGYDFLTQEFVERKTQDIAKILLTTIESTPAYPLYGSALPLIIGTRKGDDTVDRVADAVVEALSFLVAVDTSPVPSERIARIVSLQVTDGRDPREIIIRLVVAMEDGSIATSQLPVQVGT